MAMYLTTEISPKGATAEQKLDDLVRQLQWQNKQLQTIIADLYKAIETADTKK